MAAKQLKLRTLAKMIDPLDDTDQVIEAIRKEKVEFKHLEWKHGPPLGPSVTLRAKYRWVKAAISYANWEGGFIIFGVDQKGRWIGLTDEEISHVDPSKITELIDGCVFPEIPTINYAEIVRANNKFLIIHIPPSDSVPHVTTKQITDRRDNNRILLSKHAVYCRQGAKSDLATPHQHQKIIDTKIESLRKKILNTVKEVPITATENNKRSKSASEIRVVRLTDDPGAPAVRLTRNKSDQEIFMHESLHDGLFNEINNVVEASLLLSTDIPKFHFDEPVYYRIYAERQYIDDDPAKSAFLAETGLNKFYGPHLYWLSRLTAQELVRQMIELARNPHNLHTRQLIRLVTLLGQPFSDWLYKELEAQFGRETQPPNYYFSFKGIRNRDYSIDNRILSLGATHTAKIELHDGSDTTIGELLETPETAASILSNACMEVFKGNKQLTGLCRKLDILAYGGIIMERASEVESIMFEYN